MAQFYSDEDVLELTSDRCPASHQNYDYLIYVLTVLTMESKVRVYFLSVSLLVYVCVFEICFSNCFVGRYSWYNSALISLSFLIKSRTSCLFETQAIIYVTKEDVRTPPFRRWIALIAWCSPSMWLVNVPANKEMGGVYWHLDLSLINCFIIFLGCLWISSPLVLTF